MRFALALAILGGLTPPARLFAQQPALVAPTNALTPAEEQKKLIVPEGFEVQLVASEPDIQKPMQMAFDAKGRIWVTTSYHYPYAAPAGKGTDKLFILSDFDEKGKAKKVQVFAADLNIPIGILPLPDCKSCIVSSVGEILKLTDTDGDGKADKREVLFTGLGSRDTHGMYNSFTLMPDGWVYACHGFSNHSKTKGKDGHEVEMNSGNTFRFRPDGSRIEVYTRGQVNPFGMTVDPWFNLYTADCHSKPITQLIPGATYESFGSTKDALGFGPVMFGYDPGGTGMCGLTWYDADHFPKEYKGCMFLGNVVTNRVNFCRIEWTGATPKAVQQPDFIKSNDPWFRPVDIKLGPDGAIYINDFYNKIIGHYEVPLTHPQRDHDHGRMWRVVYKGKGEPGATATGGPKPAFTDLTSATDDDLVKDLVNPNLMVRMMAGNQLLHRARTGKKPKPDDDAVNKLLRNPATASGVAGWIAFLEEAMGNTPNYADVVSAAKSLAIKPDDFTTLLLRALASHLKWEAKEREVALDILNSFDAPRLKRATVEAMATHPHAEFVKPLVELIGKIPAGDTHFHHAARIALRNCLQHANGFATANMLPGSATPIVSDVALAVPDSIAAEYLTRRVKAGSIPEDRMPAVAEHVGRYGSVGSWENAIEFLEKLKSGQRALTCMDGFVRGIQSNGFSKTAPRSVSRPILVRACMELSQGNRESQFASLKLLSDLPTVLPKDYLFPDDENPKPVLARLIGEDKQADDLRGAAIDTLVRIDTKLGLTTSEKLIDAPDTSPILRERAALILAASSDRNHKQAAKDAIKSVPYRSGVVIATALASTAAGSEILLEAVKQGKASPRLLQEKNVLDRLRAARIENLDKQIADLTKGLQPADAKLAQLIKQRSDKFISAKPDKELGLKLFTKHCGACHKIGEAGGKVGPNLDGIGVRGLERLLEDTLDPNRNVDAAFRARVLDLADGTTKTGLMLRVEGEVLVMADDQGKEFRVPTKDIEKNRETALSPMPANFGEVIPEAEFFHLMGYLLDQRAKEPPKK
jgi:putative heme-binding domain-containing protein